MFTQHCILILKAQTKLFQISFNSPFHFNSLSSVDTSIKNKSIEFLTFKKHDRKLLFRWYLTHAFQWIYLFFQLVRLAQYLGFSTTHISYQVNYLIWIQAYIFICSAGLTCLKKSQEICLLFNHTLNFWSVNFPNRQPRKGTIYYVLYFWLAVATFTPVIFSSLFWITPCAPQFLLSLVSSHCDVSINGGTLSFGTMLIFFLVEVALFSPVAGLGGFLTMVLVTIVTSLLDFLKHAR